MDDDLDAYDVDDPKHPDYLDRADQARDSLRARERADLIDDMVHRAPALEELTRAAVVAKRINS